MLLLDQIEKYGGFAIKDMNGKQQLEVEQEGMAVPIAIPKLQG